EKYLELRGKVIVNLTCDVTGVSCNNQNRFINLLLYRCFLYILYTVLHKMCERSVEWRFSLTCFVISDTRGAMSLGYFYTSAACGTYAKLTH
ncbi:hypothetical protein L9F63_023659, partial [Diploptera punctata]